MTTTNENAILREALKRIVNLSPTVTHGWAMEARSIARTALAQPSGGAAAIRALPIAANPETGQ